MTGRILSKVQNTTFSLEELTTRYLLPHMHCNLIACQQLSHATYCIDTIGER